MEFGWFRKSNQMSLLTAQVILPSFIFLVAVGGLILFLGYRFHKNHVRQEQLLSYVEFERISDGISKSWDVLAPSRLKSGTDSSLLRWTESGVYPVSGKVTELSDWDQIKPKRILRAPFVTQVLGQPYIATMETDSEMEKVPTEGPFSVTIKLTPFEISELIQLTRIPLESSIVYLVSKEGQLIFSTSALVNHKNFLSRPIVQKFILNQVNASGLSFTDHNGAPGFGYSFFIPGSNLIMFAEISASAQEKGFIQTFKQSLIVALVSTFLVGIVLWLTHRRVYVHLRELAIGMERSSLIPTTSELSESRIAELSFLKNSWLSLERRLQLLYQRAGEQHNRQETNPDQHPGDPTHDPKKTA